METTVRNIQTTPMAPYAGIMSGMSQEDKLTVLSFLIGSMRETDDETLFYKYFDEWKRDTRFLSSTTAIIRHPCFLSIVEMGGNAVPFIVKEIEREPSCLVWALNAIFHSTIGKGKTITEACKLWTNKLKKY